VARTDREASLMRAATPPARRKHAPPSDLEVARSALLWCERHGDAATARARDMVEAMREKGDTDGADVWLRIIVAIGAIAELRSGARH